MIFIIESIMDHLAMSLEMDPLAVKQLNMYNKGDISYVVCMITIILMYKF